jgi:hypothetical protein
MSVANLNRLTTSEYDTLSILALVGGAATNSIVVFGFCLLLTFPLRSPRWV